MKNGRTKKNGRMRTTSQMRILAWILALVLCVPWNFTIAQEADAPVSDAALTSGANTKLANDAADGGEDSAQPEVSVISAGGTPIDVSTEEEIEQNGDVGTVFSPLSLMGPYTVSFYQQDPEGENVPENNLIEEYTGVEYNTKLGVQIKKLQSEHPEYAGVKWSEKAGHRVTNNIALYASSGVAEIEGTAYSSLSAALAEVKDGNTIKLLDDVKENVSVNDKDFTLDMKGHKVSPKEGNTTSIFTIDGGTVTLKNGTITGANVSGSGGAVKVSNGAALTLDNVSIQKNTASGNGAGVYAMNSSLTLRNGTDVSGNTAGIGGNQASTIYFKTESATNAFRAVGVSITGNTGESATYSSSAIIVLEGPSDVVNGFEDCAIEGNTANGANGATIKINGTTTNFSRCSIRNNSAPRVGGIMVGDYEADEQIPEQSTVTMNDTVVFDNTGTYAGGIFLAFGDGYFGAVPCKLVVSSGAIYGNTSTDGRGANDLLICSDSIDYNILSANAMSDPTAGISFDDYKWEDITNNIKVSGNITMSEMLASYPSPQNDRYYFTAKTTHPVARNTNTDTEYETIKEAVEDAQADEEILLMAGERDNSGTTILEEETVTIPKSLSITINLNGRTVKNSNGNDAFSVPTGADLTLKGKGTIDAPVYVNDGSLTVDKTDKEDLAIDTIRYESGSVTLKGDVKISSKIHMEQDGLFINADSAFAPKTLLFDFSSETNTVKDLNGKGEEGENPDPVVLVKSIKGETLSDTLANSISIDKCDALVVIEKDKGNIIAKRLQLRGVYLDGVNGKDESSSLEHRGLTRETPVRTFAKAKEILAEQNQELSAEGEEKLDGIYVINAVTVNIDEEWSLGDGVKLMRDPLYKNTLVKVTATGNLTLNDIDIDGMKHRTKASGPLVEVEAGGSLSVTGDTVLQNNANTGGNWGGAVLVYGNMNMRDGEIRDNSGISGGGVALMGSGAKMVLSSGTIKDNTATEGGGGISVLSGARLEMGGGLVEGNTALSGGGIMAGGLRSGSVGNGSESFSMTGGTVQGNTANSCGGGIYVQSNNIATITGGRIVDNKSLGKSDFEGRGVTYGGGGIYVNGGRPVGDQYFPDGVLYLEKPIVTENTTNKRGGGYAGCETSTTNIYHENGAAVYGNVSRGSENPNLQIFTGLYTVTYGKGFISEYMYDGTPYLWTNENGTPCDVSNMQGVEGNLTLYSTATGPKPETGTLVISGNTSTENGGGIGNNGTIQIGTPEKTKVKVTKIWNDGSDVFGVRPESVEVWLQREVDGKFVDVSCVKLKENDDVWEGEFDNPPEGYTYTVREVMPEEAVPYYSSKVTGDVTKGFTVENTLVGELNISKTTINDISPENKGTEFIFTVELKKGDEPFTGSIPYEKVKTGDGSEIESKVLEFTSEDGGKKNLTLADGQTITLKEVPYDLTYTVTETQAAGYTVKVGGKETNSAIGQIVSGESGSPKFSTDVMFTNTYAVTETTATIEGTKVLTGRDWTDSDKFEFELTETTQPEKDADGEGKEIPDALKESLTAEATKASQNFRFGPITYTVPATHTYKVAEKDTTIDGVTKDAAVYTVTVTVTDKEDGTLEAKVTSYERTTKDAEGKETTVPADSMTFTNTYKAGSTTETVESTTETVESTSTTATVTGAKELTGREWTDTDAFTFELTETTQPSMDGNGNGTEIPDKLNGIRTATATKAAKEFNFGTFEYTEPYVHTYEVRETSPSDKGITADTSVYTITVTVTDNGEGKLAASSTAAKNGASADAIIFTNTYTAEGRAILSGTKLLTGGREEPMYDNEFHFILRENGNVIERVGNHADGSITFSELHYTLADVGEHVYEIAEDKENEKRVTYSERMFTVRVIVTDNLDGTLNTQVEYPEGGVTFENVYAPKKSEKTEKHIFGQLDVTKLLYASEGHPLIADDAKFYVALFSDEARTLRVSEVKELRYSDSAAATVTFEDLRLGATYYVGETDECGVLKGSGVIDNATYLAEYPDGYAVKLTKSHSHGHVAIHNTFYEIPQGFYYGGELTITKKVQMGGEDYATDEVFYAGVFKDAALTKREGDVIALWMEGASMTSQILPVHVGTSGTETVTYYVAETDEHGNVLDPDSSLEFTISLNHKSVQMSVMDFRKKVVITNDFVEESTETETKEDETETENVPAGAETPKTGDGTPIGMYLLLLAVSFAVMLTVGLKRKERE